MIFEVMFEGESLTLKFKINGFDNSSLSDAEMELKKKKVLKLIAPAINEFTSKVLVTLEREKLIKK